MKIANMDREILHNFWMTSGISMKFSGKMWLMIIWHKKSGFHPLYKRFSEKSQGVKLTPPPSPPSRFRVKFVLINIYNCNTESQQLLTLTELHKIRQNIDDIENMNIIIRGDYNFQFNSKLEAKRRKPTLKKKYIGKMIELIECFELCDIWRIRNTTEKRFTFRQNHISR